MQTKTWNFPSNTIHYSPDLIKKYFKLFRRSLHPKIKYVIVIITTYQNKVQALSNPVNPIIVEIGDYIGEKVFYHTTVFEQPICIKLRGESVHSFFKFVDSDYENYSTLAKKLINMNL